MKAIIYHNPRCSKSRATKVLLETAGVELDVIEYLETPPSRETLMTLLTKLELEAKDLVRTGEADFKASGVNLRTATRERIVDLLIAYPKLIQRPIVEVTHAARIGRPPESVLELFE